MYASFFNNQEFGERNKNAEYLSRKKRPVAWFVSNCDTPSNRMEYIKGMFYTQYSIVKNSSADLGVNFKIVQNRPTVKTVCTKISKKCFAYLSIFLYF